MAYAVGYTGLGVASTRFGAAVALDLVDGKDTELTRLGMVRRKPIPFPPEPIRYAAVRATRSSLAAEDRTGRRNLWLRALDRSASASTPEDPSSCRGSRSSAALPRLGAMTGGHRVSARVAAWAGVDTDWERFPHDAAHARRVDTWVALAFLVTASLGVELLRSIDALGAQEHSWLWPHVAVALGTVPLVWRRRWPLAVAAWLSLHLFAFGILMPSIAVSMPMQVVYFFAIFTGVAWARDRRAMLGVVVGVVLLMFGWLALAVRGRQRRRGGA